MIIYWQELIMVYGEQKIQSTSIKTIESGFTEITNYSQKQNGDKVIRTIEKCAQGGIWILTSDNISRIIFQQNSDEPVIIEDFSINTNQTIATEDSTENLWIATLT